MTSEPAPPPEDRMSVDRQPAEQQQPSAESTFTCPTCQKVFVRLITYKIHVKAHGVSKPYACEECGERFWQPDDLEQHSRAHKSDRPYACMECGERFWQPDDLEQHSRAHKSDRPYACAACPKTYTQSAARKKHVAVAHTRSGEDDKQHPQSSTQPSHHRYQCALCPALFYNRYYMLKHARAVHLSYLGKLSCPVCCATFWYFANLIKHLRTKHYATTEARQAIALWPPAKRQPSYWPKDGARFPTSCHVCARPFVNPASLRHHVRVAHPGADVPAGRPRDINAAAVASTQRPPDINAAITVSARPDGITCLSGQSCKLCTQSFDPGRQVREVQPGADMLNGRPPNINAATDVSAQRPPDINDANSTSTQRPSGNNAATIASVQHPPGINASATVSARPNGITCLGGRSCKLCTQSFDPGRQMREVQPGADILSGRPPNINAATDVSVQRPPDINAATDASAQRPPEINDANSTSTQRPSGINAATIASVQHPPGINATTTVSARPNGITCLGGQSCNLCTQSFNPGRQVREVQPGADMLTGRPPNINAATDASAQRPSDINAATVAMARPDGMTCLDGQSCKLCIKSFDPGRRVREVRPGADILTGNPPDINAATVALAQRPPGINDANSTLTQRPSGINATTIASARPGGNTCLGGRSCKLCTKSFDPGQRVREVRPGADVSARPDNTMSIGGRSCKLGRRPDINASPATRQRREFRQPTLDRGHCITCEECYLDADRPAYRCIVCPTTNNHQDPIAADVAL